jgi:hypothetical protein
MLQDLFEALTGVRSTENKGTMLTKIIKGSNARYSYNEFRRLNKIVAL